MNIRVCGSTALGFKARRGAGPACDSGGGGILGGTRWTQTSLSLSLSRRARLSFFSLLARLHESDITHPHGDRGHVHGHMPVHQHTYLRSYLAPSSYPAICLALCVYLAVYLALSIRRLSVREKGEFLSPLCFNSALDFFSLLFSVAHCPHGVPAFLHLFAFFFFFFSFFLSSQVLVETRESLEAFSVAPASSPGSRVESS